MNDTNVGGTRAQMLTALLHDAPKAEDHDGVREFVCGLTGLGCAPLLISPGTKVPIDLRTPATIKAADKAEQLAAREAGQRGWRRRKSKAGAYLATTEVDALLKAKTGYLDRYIKLLAANYPDGPVPVNVALSPGSSRLVVVDCDTAEQMAAFLTDMSVPVTTPPTVRTPGAIGPDGQWIHSEGGHWWFVVPEGVELPDSVGALTDPTGGYTVMWGAGRYALVPPSVRAEGAYVAAGGVWTLPPQLVERIASYAEGRAVRARGVYDRAREGDDAITAWGAVTPWGSILVDADGWLNTGKADSCGCDIWTAPGVHDSPKSATAHEPGCAVWVDSPDPPLHIWTTGDCDPFTEHVRDTGKTAITRLRAYAAIHHDNETGAAMTALDLHDDGDGFTLGEDGSAEDGDQDADADSVSAAVTLPGSFWESRPSLRHIRDAALVARAAPDATLGAALARVSAWTPPAVTVDTGIMSPLPLNLYTAATSWSGKGKTSAMDASENVLSLVPEWSKDLLTGNELPVLCPPGESFPRIGKIRSGEGIAEMYWGETMMDGPNGKPIKTRTRMRSNVLMHTDEASGLVKHMVDPKQTVGETLREMWSGQHSGQSNAENARYRFVERGTYRLALILGFHLSVLADLLTDEQTLIGTPQRFLCLWSKPDPAQISRDMLEQLSDPGPLTVRIPATGLRLCAQLRTQVDDERIAEWLRDDSGESTPDLRSQRVAMVARLAALLAILDGRTERDDMGTLVVNEQDWELAETMYETSCAIAALAVADRKKRAATGKRVVRARELAETIEDEDARATPESRAMARVRGYLAGGGKHKWTGSDGLRRKFNGDHAADADQAVETLAASGELRRTKNGSTVYVQLSS